MKLSIKQLRRIIKETVDIVDMNQGARDIPDDALNALKSVPKIAQYVGQDEEEFAGSWRGAVTNSLQIYQDDSGSWHADDIDGMVFGYMWDGRRWLPAR